MIAYGYPVKEQDDPFVSVVEAAVSGFSETLEPGAFLVDMIPLRELHFIHLCVTGDANNNTPQCDMYLIGSLERDGRSRPNDLRNFGQIRRRFPFNL